MVRPISVVFLATLAVAQSRPSLGEAARDARSKKDAAHKSAARVYDNQSLGRSGHIGLRDGPPLKEGQKPSEADLWNAAERDYRARFADIRRQVTVCEEQIKSFQQDIQKLARDPADPDAAVLVKAARAGIEARRKRIAELRQEAKDLEAELVAKGYPVTWAN